MKKLSAPSRIPERPVFHPMEWDEPWAVPGYRRNLPHWRLEGATYFITFRLADSIPESVARHWHEEREAWLRQQGLDPRLATGDPECLHASKKEVRVLDYVDDAVPMLARMYEKRIRGYEAVGYQIRDEEGLGI